MSTSPRRARADAPVPPLVPAPMHVEGDGAKAQLTSKLSIAAQRGSADVDNVAKQLADALRRATGWAVPIEQTEANTAKPGQILLTLIEADSALGPEGYTLDVSRDGGVTIRSTGGAGLFYGMQTLLQLLPPHVYADGGLKGRDSIELPVVKIQDKPRFAWRGLMLDVSRHFFTKDEVKQYIDALARHKMNTFHWHLVDDTGWRIEIKKYPRLTEVGAWRKGIDFGLDPKESTAYGPDGRYGGYYTQDDVREVIAYAKTKYVTIVPEIEMPGHSVAALAAYPKLSCEGEAGASHYSTDIGPGVHAGVYCAGNDETFTFLQDVLSEVIDLFPGPFIHVGGDEVPKGPWKKCPKCQERIKAEGLKNEDELQSYFIKRMEKVVTSKGKRLIGWDEILEGGLAPGATVMSWRGTAGGIAAAEADHDVVMTPTTNCYLDYAQARWGEPHNIGGYLPLERVYAFNPLAGIAPEKQHHVLGVGANLWTEYVPNFPYALYMVYPRGSAIAEVGWSPAPAPAQEKRNFDEFRERMKTHVKRLEAQGVNYRPLDPPGLDDAIQAMPGDPPKIAFQRLIEGADVRYTLDGSAPTKDSPRFSDPVPLPKTLTPVRVRYFVESTPASYVSEALFLPNWLGQFSTSLGTGDAKHPPANAFDGNDETFFYANQGAQAGDDITVNFIAPHKVNTVRIATGNAQHPNDKIEDGVLEATTDGKTWTKFADLHDGSGEGSPGDQPVRAVRVRVTKDEKARRIVVREFSIKSSA